MNRTNIKRLAKESGIFVLLIACAVSVGIILGALFTPFVLRAIERDEAVHQQRQSAHMAQMDREVLGEVGR